MKPPTSEDDLRLLACDYAEHVLHLFEKEYPDDDRVRMCIELTRASVLDPDLTKEERREYRAAANAATAAASASAAAAASSAAAAASYAASAAYWAAKAKGQDCEAAREAENAWQRKKMDEWGEPEVLL